MDNQKLNQKMTSVLLSVECVSLSNGIYNNNANINNFQQPPFNNDAQKFNNSANKTVTEIGFSMKSTPCDVNKINYTKINQVLNEPLNEESMKQPYQNNQIYNKNNGGNGGNYQPRNMYLNHDSLVY